MNRLAERIAAGRAALQRDHLARSRRMLDSAQGTRVTVGGRTLVNFSSNDYLGLATHPALRQAATDAIAQWGVGAGASPLVSGHLAVHDEAERAFARFAGQERAVLFGSGYAANLGILGALCDRDAEIFGDRLDHACLIDGARLSRAAFTRFAHADVAALEERLAASSAAIKVVTTDAVFSMDGDIAPLAALLDACERHDAWLVVDDAHGIGVLGGGRGTLHELGIASDRIVYMATLGKALGGYGAFACGPAEAMDWLVQRARTYVFSTALPPACAAVAMAAMGLVERSDSPVPLLHARIAQFRAGCAAAGIPVTDSRTAIQPLVVGEPERALRAAADLLEQGCWVPAIRPPTVPAGTSRLRVSLSAAHTASDVDALVAALSATLSR